MFQSIHHQLPWPNSQCWYRNFCSTSCICCSYWRAPWSFLCVHLSCKEKDKRMNGSSGIIFSLSLQVLPTYITPNHLTTCHFYLNRHVHWLPYWFNLDCNQQEGRNSRILKSDHHFTPQTPTRFFHFRSLYYLPLPLLLACLLTPLQFPWWLQAIQSSSPFTTCLCCSHWHAN